MSEHQERHIEKWMRYAAIFGPFIGFLFGIPSGAIFIYKSMQDQSQRISLLEGFKEKQDAFNEKTVIAITRLKVIVKDLQP